MISSDIIGAVGDLRATTHYHRIIWMALVRVEVKRSKDSDVAFTRVDLYKHILKRSPIRLALCASLSQPALPHYLAYIPSPHLQV